MAHGCQCHLKLVSAKPGTRAQDFPSLPCHILCPFRASSSARHNMTLFVQQSSTPTAHICILILQKAHSPCSEPAPVALCNAEPIAVAKEHRRKATKGWEAKPLTCLQMAEMCPETIHYLCPQKASLDLHCL